MAAEWSHYYHRLEVVSITALRVITEELLGHLIA